MVLLKYGILNNIVFNRIYLVLKKSHHVCRKELIRKRINWILYLLVLLAEFTPHSDSITCIDFLDKDDRMFVLTSSSDCSVVLSDIHGNAYGTFGQPNQWRVDMDLTKTNEDDLQNNEVKDDDESEEETSKKFDEKSQSAFSQDLDALSSMTDEEMLTRRSNVWESTSIGKSIDWFGLVWKFFLTGVSFQEKRTNRRQRNQPSLITKKDYVLWEKTGLAPGGAYGVSQSFLPIDFSDHLVLYSKALDTFDPPPIPDNKKSAYLDTAYLWHSATLGDGARRRPPPSMIGESKR